ncbi:MAG TPA: response regulator [Pedobacter sp.]|uniref:hybrid sensor histidine kinase/response regulator n=1 Tax=Pedobacter sp. TaxID=1411316 RepID=UPI002BCE4C14|nr:response regulator [Pedobacter sp.]HMI03840.1 response regulator [Pedobacter sp.]
MFKLSFKQQVLTGFAVSLAFVLVSAATSYFSIKSLGEDARWTSHTYEVLNLVQKIENQALSAETGVRGYVLSQQNKFLEPYTLNAAKIGPTIRELRKLVSDNPEQSDRVDSLEFYANEKLADMQGILESSASKGRTASLEQILTGNGQRIKDKMLRVSNKITKTEYLLLAKRKADTDKSNTRTTWIVLLSAVIIFGLILFLFSYIKRTFDQQKLTEEQMRDSNIQLEKISADNEQKNWLLTGATEVTESMRGEQEIEELSANVVSRICNYIGAGVGALFLLSDKKKTFVFRGGYAYQQSKSTRREYSFGEGLIGQAAIEKKSKVLDNIPEDYLKISSALGNAAPSFIFILPIIFENSTIAVIELGLTEKPDESKLIFLNTITESIGVAINSAIARVKLRALFEQTQQQAEELESQQEELRTTNEELVYKSEQLQASEEELRVQQEELRQTNAELEEKAQQLEERNLLVNQAREAMSLKAEELELSSKYKSEFLANMSHELRTPLNSILILARILKENKPENLNEDQVKYAGVIHNAGTDLLTLINDILDLSKIESGKIDLTIEPVRPQSIKQGMEALFAELAKSKKIRFEALLDHDLPETILTDQSRLEQVIKNLLSNAFKFTSEHGQITFSISNVHKGHRFYSDQLNSTPEKVLAFRVEDSGIGIPEDKQRLIFEAFQQADGSTSRKYGGTGLGLSISKELAVILGGEIQVQSEVNSGSTFTLFIPERNIANAGQETHASEEKTTQESGIRTLIPEPATMRAKGPRPQTLLIVEDDLAFAEVLSDYAIEKGFQPILAHSGDTGLEMAASQLPDAIVLDIMLPVMDGWTILKKLKSDPRTRHIPVHMMSAGTVKESEAKQQGAIGFLKKPIEKDQLDEAFELLSTAYTKYNLNKVLVIEDQELQSKILTQQLSDKGVEVKQAFTGNEALELLKTQVFDCIILDLKLPDISGFDLLDKIKSQPQHAHVPVIINTAMELDDDKMAHIMKYTEAMVLKSNKSNDRLIDEVSLFMNKLKQDDKPASKTTAKGKSVSTIEKALKGKTILITDDDMRNIFALSSALQGYEINIHVANNGKEAIQKLQENQEIDLVLMDIMMPEMDGYEAMRAIRGEKKFAKLPIIALTAKAMKNDREKCIEAGANDYISKPVDMDKLLSMLRVWLS